MASTEIAPVEAHRGAAAGTSVLADADLVRAWDAAAGEPGWRQPLAFLGALRTLDHDAPEPVDELPIGAIAGGLLRRVRSWWSGPCTATSRCTACAEALEIELPLDALIDTEVDVAPFAVDVDGHRLTVRPLRPADIAAAAEIARSAPELVPRALVERCVVACTPAVDDVVVFADEIGAALDRRDPLASMRFAVTCPSCGAGTAPVADLAQWCWALADARVRRMLSEVHRLATAYGWSEEAVLALGPHRRAMYLEMVP